LAELIPVVRPPAKGFPRRRESACVPLAARDRRELDARRYGLWSRRAAVLRVSLSAERIGPSDPELAVLTASPAKRGTSGLEGTRMVAADAHGLPIALAIVIEHGIPAGR
jgi:hypothetical protein